MEQLYEKRGFVVFIEVLYLLILFALALIYLTDLHNRLNVLLPASFGSLPVGVPWFGALGAVIISLSGAFDHRTDWDPSWNLWHFTRPLIGVSLAIVSWLILQAGILAVGSTAPGAQGPAVPTNLLYYLIAFVVGYREAVFRDLIKRVADVILTPAASQPAVGTPPLKVNAINPARGSIAGGDTVTITGSGLAGTRAVKFGPNAASAIAAGSDAQITAITPPGTPGPVDVTVTTSAASVTSGRFTYENLLGGSQ